MPSPFKFSSFDVFQPPSALNNTHTVDSPPARPNPSLQFTFSPHTRPSADSTASVESGSSSLNQTQLPASMSPLSINTGSESPRRPSLRRQSSVQLQQVPPHILLPFVDRPSEMDLLMKYNQSFFSMLKRSVGDDVYEQQLLPLLRSPREKLDDIAFLIAIKRILCVGDAGSSRMWIEFCRIVGCNDHDLPPSPSVPSSFMRLPPALDLDAETNESMEKVQFRNQDPFSSSHRREYSEGSAGGVSPTFTFRDPIIEED
ncbi:hypothetical protein V1525DRAFT_393785 [Lipomyces kononenkoae]|uniref:Uncharacterized protein n=1 Tax=Lipomyces kononenkoae TaxID=34357 RepID=A0ACC3TBX4_LIPKO